MLYVQDISCFCHCLVQPIETQSIDIHLLRFALCFRTINGQIVQKEERWDTTPTPRKPFTLSVYFHTPRCKVSDFYLFCKSSVNRSIILSKCSLMLTLLSFRICTLSFVLGVMVTDIWTFLSGFALRPAPALFPPLVILSWQNLFNKMHRIVYHHKSLLSNKTD